MYKTELIVVVSLATLCSAYPMNNEIIGLKNAPNYHIRIDIGSNDGTTDHTICFGALVHQNYIIAPRDKCLDQYNRNKKMIIYAARNKFSDISNGVISTNVNCSTKYNIGVIFQENGIKDAIPIKVKANEGSHVEDNSNVRIYGFGTYFLPNERINVMKKRCMTTISKEVANTYFHHDQINDYMFRILSRKSGIFAVDYGSPIEYTDRLIALFVYANNRWIDNETILVGIELNHPQIANEFSNLSNGNIIF